MKRVSLTKLFTFGCALTVVQPVTASDFTLSDSAILSLDYNMPFSAGSPPPTASVVSKQDTPGIGVQFNLHFVSTNWPDNILSWISSSSYGTGALTTMSVGSYSNFCLKFTLLSIDGSTSGSQIALVGSLIGPYQAASWAYNPDPVSLSGYYPSSAVSTMAVTSATLSNIGFIVEVWPYGGWSAGPH